MASLDAARRQMAQSGEKLINKAVKLSCELRRRINDITGLYCFGEELINQNNFFTLDHTKLTVNFRQLGITGFEAERVLRHKYKIQCELSDMYNVLFIISLADGEKECEFLYKALSDLAADCSNKKAKNLLQQTMPALPERRMLPRQAVFAEYETILFARSQGRICAETITFYPPGVPLIYPGEVISFDLIDYIEKGRQAGAKIVGPADITMQTVRVVK